MALSPTEKQRGTDFLSKVGASAVGTSVLGMGAGTMISDTVTGNMTGGLIGAGIGAGIAVGHQIIKARKHRALGRQFKD